MLLLAVWLHIWTFVAGLPRVHLLLCRVLLQHRLVLPLILVSRLRLLEVLVVILIVKIICPWARIRIICLKYSIFVRSVLLLRWQRVPLHIHLRCLMNLLLTVQLLWLQNEHFIILMLKIIVHLILSTWILDVLICCHLLILAPLCSLWGFVFDTISARGMVHYLGG